MKTQNRIFSLLLLLSLLLCLAACGGTGGDPWKDAIHKEDITLGEGSTTVTVEVAAGKKSIRITLKTDEAYLGDALAAEDLITGEEGDFGLYMKTVNGILADYNTDGTYWALYIDGDYATTGVDTTPIAEGAFYKLSKDKG